MHRPRPFEVAERARIFEALRRSGFTILISADADSGSLVL